MGEWEDPATGDIHARTSSPHWASFSFSLKENQEACISGLDIRQMRRPILSPIICRYLRTMAKVTTVGQKHHSSPHKYRDTQSGGTASQERTKPGEWEPKYAGGSFPSVPSCPLRSQVDYPKRKPTPKQILIIVLISSPIPVEGSATTKKNSFYSHPTTL